MNRWTHFLSCWLKDAQLWVAVAVAISGNKQTGTVAEKYLSRWKTERNQLKRMQITSDISANTKQIFIYEMNAWAGTVRLDCALWQLGLQRGHVTLHYKHLIRRLTLFSVTVDLAFVFMVAHKKNVVTSLCCYNLYIANFFLSHYHIIVLFLTVHFN